MYRGRLIPSDNTAEILNIPTIGVKVMAGPVLESIQVGLPRCLGEDNAADPMDRLWTTGFFKQPVSGAVWLASMNLDGDGQADRAHHGGLDKAVLAYSAGHYPGWRITLDNPSLSFGAFGENFIVKGLAESDICIGDTWRVGDCVVIQVSQPRQPCWKLARRWRIKTLALQVQETGRTGWYNRVLREGYVEAGMPLSLIERPYPKWTVARANRVMHIDRLDLAAALELAANPLLSGNWRTTLSRRAQQQESDPAKRLFGENEACY